jgi:hypothetical protein
MKNPKPYNHLSYISFKTVPLCNYKLLPATMKVWETFLEAVFERLFSSSVFFLMMLVESQKFRLFYTDFGQGNRYKSAAARSGKYRECSSVVTFFLTKTDRCAEALSWRRKRQLVLHFSRRFLLIALLGRRRMSMYISLFTALQKFPSCSSSCNLYLQISVNYTTEFREIFEAST